MANSTQDEEVLVRVRLTNSNDRGPGVALRHTMSGTTETAYVAYFRPGINGLEVDKFPNGAFSDLADIAFPQTVGSWYWMRFRVQGTTLSLKVWADAANEPSAWTWTGSDAAISSGSVGVYVYEPNTVDYDAFAVGTGGLTAPTPQLGSSSATLTQVLLTPDTATVQAGATQQFQANGLMSDNTTRPISVNYSATGGAITAGGLYTAGNTTGTFRVIATEPTSGLADTSSVTFVPESVNELSSVSPLSCLSPLSVTRVPSRVNHMSWLIPLTFSRPASVIRVFSSDKL